MSGARRFFLLGGGPTLLLAAGMLVATAATAAPVVSLVDPPGDDSGPGSYRYPTSPEYAPGSFDLRRVDISVDGDEAIIAVTLGAPLRKPVEVRRTLARLLDLSNSIYVQNVDLYIDNRPGEGFTSSIPGRNVTFDPTNAWDVAVVFTPMPYDAASVIKDAMPKEASRVLVPGDLSSGGCTVAARVKLAVLGGPPSPDWGYQVLVTGAVWEKSSAVIDRITGTYQPNAFTMPVTTLAEAAAGGGAELDHFHANVMDLLAPDAETQSRLLRSFDAKAGRLAVIPSVNPNPAAKPAQPGPAPATARPAFTVKAVDGQQIVIAAPKGTIREWAVADVIDADGGAVARIIIHRVFDDFVLATAMDGADRIKVGAGIRLIEPKGAQP